MSDSKPAIWLHNADPIRVFERVTCYRIAAHAGEGTEESPHRLVVIWFTEDGEVIARSDVWETQASAAEAGRPSPSNKGMRTSDSHP